MKTLGEKRFVGGKGADGVWQRIVNLCPPHRVLIEAFAGEGILSRKIRPAAETILIDKVKQPGLELMRPGFRFVLGDGIQFVKGYKWKGDELLYCDPPYLLTTRGNRAYYEHEMTEADHRRLLAVLKSINARVLLSGYRSPLYDRELADWNRVEFQAMTRGGTPATEVLWFNYPRPVALHDYSVVGEVHADRWRLRKKIRRAVADLASMPPLERGAMFAAMARCLTGEELRAALAHDGTELRSCVPPELARQACPATNGAPSSNADPRAGNGAPAGDALEQHIIGPQLLRAYRDALSLASRRLDSPTQFDGCSTLAGTIAEKGNSYFVRVEVRPERTAAGEPKLARAAGVTRRNRRASSKPAAAAVTPPTLAGV